MARVLWRVSWVCPLRSALPAGAVIAGLASIALSLPSLRVSGDYLVIASIGFQLGLLQIIKNVEFTGGPGGFSNIEPLFSTHSAGALLGAAAIAWTCAFGAVVMVRWLVSGPYGRAITAMRDDEEAFAGLGRKAMQIKVTLFAIACAIAGLAGGLYAHNYQFVSPEQFDIVASATILTMVVVGGVRTVWGPVCGAILLQLLPQADPLPRAAVVHYRAAARAHFHGPRADVPVRAAKRPARRQGCSACG